MTTNIELRNWLFRFPDDTIIEVVTAQEGRGYWETYVSTYSETPYLPDIPLSDITYSTEHLHVVFEGIEYDVEQGCTHVGLIRLGKTERD